MIPTQTILGWLWVLVGVYWLISALGAKKIAVNEAPASRLLRLVLLCVMFTLLLTDRLGVGLLAWRFVPDYSWIRWIGVALTMAGLALCVWARHHLGEYWSDKVALKVDHQLIRSGPYAYLRHPIYSGVLLGVAGDMEAGLVLGDEGGRHLGQGQRHGHHDVMSSPGLLDVHDHHSGGRHRAGRDRGDGYGSDQDHLEHG